MREKSSLNIKKFLLLTMVGVGISLIVSSVPSLGKTKIEFWTNQTQEERLAKYRSFARSFEKEHPDYTVEIVPYGEEVEFVTKWTSAKMAGELPQVVEAEMWAALKIIFDELGNPSVANQVIRDLGEWNFFEFPLSFVTYKGTYHAVPSSVFGVGIWCRTDIFNKYGVEPLGKEVTFNELLEAAEKLHHPRERIYGITTPTAKEIYVQQYNLFANAVGARIFNKQGEVVVNSEKRNEWIEFLTFYRNLCDYTQPGPQAASDLFHNFTAGTTAMSVVASFLPRYIENTDPSIREVTSVTWKVVEKEPATFFVACAYIPIREMSSEQEKATAEWLKFLMTGNTRVEYLNLVPGGFNPVQKTILYSDEYLNYPVRKKWGKEFFTRLVEASNKAIHWGRFPDGTIITKIADAITSLVIQEEIFKVCEEGKSVEEAVKSIDERLKRVLKQ